MRTTVTLAADVTAEVQRLRRDEGMGTSEAINHLARRGMTPHLPRRSPYRLPTYSLGRPRIELTSNAALLDAIEDPPRAAGTPR